jgi:hypothetical protein
MTSFTKALYNRDPAAAEAFRRHSRLDRVVYGKTPTMACFTMAEALPTQDGRTAPRIGDYEDALVASRDPLGLSRFADRKYRSGGSR